MDSTYLVLDGSLRELPEGDEALSIAVDRSACDDREQIESPA